MTINPEKSKAVAEIRKGRIRIAIWERPISASRFYLAGQPEVGFIDDTCEWSIWKVCTHFQSQELRDLGTIVLQAAEKIDALNAIVRAEERRRFKEQQND